jgi:hypothetical protein
MCENSENQEVQMFARIVVLVEHCRGLSLAVEVGACPCLDCQASEACCFEDLVARRIQYWLLEVEEVVDPFHLDEVCQEQTEVDLHQVVGSPAVHLVQRGFVAVDY